MTNFQRPMTVRVIRVNTNDHPIQRGIRLYCSQFGSAWELQLHSPMGLGSHGAGNGKRSINVDATLTREDMIALRNAINAELLQENHNP
mgnify:CR=1 FL=1